MIGLAMMLMATATPDQVLLSQRQLDAISKRCSSPKRWLNRRSGWIYVSVDPKTDYRKVECVLAQLKRRHAGPYGFIGNDVRQ